MSFEPFGPWLHLGIIIVLFTIGGFIGNWIGKKRDYRLPLSPYAILSHSFLRSTIK
ncbi:MAG: hypothetical protein ACTSPN_04040 [Promethearchaeota archaeon]